MVLVYNPRECNGFGRSAPPLSHGRTTAGTQGMETMVVGWLVVAGLLVSGPGEPDGAVRVTVPLVSAGEVNLSELVARLASATGVDVPRPSGEVSLPLRGLAGNLGRKMLRSSLGPEVFVSVEERELVLVIRPRCSYPVGEVTGRTGFASLPRRRRVKSSEGAAMGCVRCGRTAPTTRRDRPYVSCTGSTRRRADSCT